MMICALLLILYIIYLLYLEVPASPSLECSISHGNHNEDDKLISMRVFLGAGRGALKHNFE